MHIRVNGDDVSDSVGDSQTIGAVLSQLREEDRMSPEEVVLELQVDGERMTGFEDGNVMDAELDGDAEPSIQTGNQADFVRRILHDAEVTVDVLSRACEKVARAFEEKTPEQANRELLLLLDTVQKLTDTLLTAKTALGGSVSNPQKPAEIKALKECLNTIYWCQEEGCWDELAENLRGDTRPAIEELRGLVSRLKGRV